MTDNNTEITSQEKPASSSDKRNLLLRVASALVLVPVALAGLYVGGLPYLLGVWVIFGLGLHEWIRMLQPDAKLGFKVLMQIVLAFAFGVGLSVPPDTGWMALGGSFLLMGEVAGLFSRKKKELYGKSGYKVAAGILVLGLSGMAMMRLRLIPGSGLAILLYLCLVVWGTDTGAYFVGRLIGGPKLAPSISPKKTWAGLIGGMAFASLFGYGVAIGFAWPLVGRAVLWAPILAVVAQVGDLFESYLKRSVGVKDSGTIIPGHGGVLDRIDGLLFASVALDLLLIAFGQGILGLPPFNL